MTFSAAKMLFSQCWRPYSIIISTYNRYETFLYLLNHYGTQDVPHLDAIFINWVSVGPTLQEPS